MYDLYICNPFYKYKKQLTQKVFFIYLISGLPQTEELPQIVMPAETGIQEQQSLLDSRFHGNDAGWKFWGGPKDVLNQDVTINEAVP